MLKGSAWEGPPFFCFIEPAGLAGGSRLSMLPPLPGAIG